MRIYVILGALCVVASGEKKINLEDIEKDNLRAESKVKSENGRTEEAQYSSKPDISQHHYQVPSNRYDESANPPAAYVATQQGIKYTSPPAEYSQTGKYQGNDAVYQQHNTILPEQNVQYYNEYEQPQDLSAKNSPLPVYEPQQLIYQPEVVIGNQVQSIQQKAVTDKYAKSPSKETVYVDIPMTQLLSYYPNLQQLAAQAMQQLSIPLYMPLFGQKQLVPPVKPAYQIEPQYAPKYPVPLAFASKAATSAYNVPASPKKPVARPSLAPVYLQPDQHYSPASRLLTQAYVAQPQPRYAQQLVYSQPGPVFAQPVQQYADLYVRGPAYVQDNSIQNGQPGQEYAQIRQLYVSPEAIRLYAKKLLQQQDSLQSVSQDYAKAPEEPNEHFVPPQLPAQSFKSGITQLVPVSSGEDETVASRDHSDASQPRSLLDTYVPSKLIAAQDSARYKERPLYLEGGFLPSKVNFVHKKRRVQ